MKSLAEEVTIFSGTPVGETLLRAQEEIDRLRAELETERMRLAACGVVAMSNTQESAARSRDMHPDYWCASVQDVANAVDREIALRAENEALQAKLDRAVKILSEIHLMLCPPKTYADGKTHVFRPPNVAEYWQELSERIRAIPDALDAAMRPSGEPK